ncbi:hypothetical protein NQZ68_017813 [Dissostichus eleginoides]|nr:hypothetical protein NQZ68_017813 [Dissostichus eleginoides]
MEGKSCALEKRGIRGNGGGRDGAFVDGLSAFRLAPELALLRNVKLLQVDQPVGATEV